MAPNGPQKTPLERLKAAGLKVKTEAEPHVAALTEEEIVMFENLGTTTTGKGKKDTTGYVVDAVGAHIW